MTRKYIPLSVLEGPAGADGSRKAVPCREYGFMARVAQWGNVSDSGVFHTPRLGNRRDAPAG